MWSISSFVLHESLHFVRLSAPKRNYCVFGDELIAYGTDMTMAPLRWTSS